MNLLLQNLKRFIDDDAFDKKINKEDIQLLKPNQASINAFWDRYYAKRLPNIVICGINPGRFGAGQTGIPFLDNRSLSEMGFSVENSHSERSAEFFYSVIEAIGVERFFNRFYVTNLSAIGYIKHEKNINYYDLPIDAQNTVFANFLDEMDAIKPTHIISLSVHVQNDIQCLIKNGSLSNNIDCTLRLPHPSWVMTYRQKSKDMWKNKYLSQLQPFL